MPGPSPPTAHGSPASRIPGETLQANVWKEDGRLLAGVIAPARDNAVVLTGVELVPA